MGSIVLIRHAQASFGADDYDKLSALGHQQARWLAEHFDRHGLAFDRVVRGGLRRHRETAEALAALGIGPEPQVDPRWDELHYGPLAQEYRAATGVPAMMGRKEFLHHFPKVFCGWAEGRLGLGSESFDAFTDRVHAALDAAAAPGASVLVVTSGGVIGVVLARVLGLDARTTADLLLNIHNASIHRLLLEDGALRLDLFNASPHFDPTDRAHARTYI